jgi:hypothetical protein
MTNDTDIDDKDDDKERAGAKEKPDDEALLRKLKAWERTATSHWSKWRKEAKRCYGFVAGDQWNAEDKAKMLDEMRAPIVFNRSGPMVDAVTGAEILNRQEVRYSPREIGDVKVNEIITSAAEWARDQTDAEDEESDAFHDVIVCGLGWTETRMDYERDAEGMVQIDRIDPLEMWSDPKATKRNLADRRYQFRAHWQRRDELAEGWRKRLNEYGGSGEGSQEMGTSHSSRKDDYDEEEDGDGQDQSKEEDKNRVWVRHFQWFDVVDAYKMSDPMTGKVAVMPKDKMRGVIKMFVANGMQPPEMVKIQQRQYREAWLAGNVVMEQRDIACNDFTIHCITGKRDRNANTFFGIVRAMIDPQMWANKWLSQILHILNTSAKGGVLFETNAFANPRKAQDEWARPDSMIEVGTGVLSRGAIQERTAANYPNGIANLMEFAVNSMPQVTGINLELLGLVQKEQAGVLEAQRKQAGYAILAVFFDALRRYRKMQGRVMLHYIQKYMSDGRLVRVMGENGNEQYVPLIRDKETVTYDVIVDDAPMSANQKENVWGMMVQLMPMLSKQPVPAEVWSELLKYSPLPSSVSTKIAKAISGPEEPTPEMQAAQAAMQLDIAQKAADVEKTKAEAAKIASEAQSAGSDMQAKVAEMQINAQGKQAELQMKAAEHQMTMAQKAQEHQFKMASAADAHQLKTQQASTAFAQKQAQMAAKPTKQPLRNPA